LKNNTQHFEKPNYQYFSTFPIFGSAALSPWVRAVLRPGRAGLRRFSAMPSYDEALTVFSEARSLLARAEDAMQHAVQAEQQKSAELRQVQW